MREASETAAALASEEAVRQELLTARGRPPGLSPQIMAHCPVMCGLLGNGDPEVAHVQLSLKILEIIESEDDVMALEATCYSLGLTTTADTHLRRLEEFGAKHFLDQRQARRYSDRGVSQRAPKMVTFDEETTIRLVWRGEVWPKFTVVLTGDIDASTVTSETLAAACAVTLRGS